MPSANGANVALRGDYWEPRPRAIPKSIRAHGDVRVDEWHWLAKGDSPRVKAHIAAENAHAKAVFGESGDLADTLFEEICEHVGVEYIKPSRREGGWLYFERVTPGYEYPTWWRRGGGVEELLLDPNELCGSGFCKIGAVTVSPDGRTMAYTIDRDGSEAYETHFVSLPSGKELARVTRTIEDGCWSSEGVYYFTRSNKVSECNEVWWWIRGWAATKIFTCPDKLMALGVEISSDGSTLLIRGDCHTVSEVWFLALDEPWSEPVSLGGRTNGVKYQACYHSRMGRWFAITNLGAVDGRVLSSTGPAPLAEWEEHANEIAGCGVDGLRLTAHFLVLDEHYEGDSQLRVMPLGEGKQYVIKGSDLVGRGVRGITLLEFCEFDRDTIWFKTEGGGAPPIFWRYNLRSRKATKLARQRVGGGFNAKDYHTLREWARGDDGERIPISIFKRKDTPVDGSAPCMLEAYGAYGVAWDPSWSPSQLAMVNRGVVLAVAHVRGGGEKGASWWVSGKLENKENTFTDTVACAKHLLANGWAAKGRLAIRGGSAGGLTVGNALNAAPELFCAALLEAPFLDMATTMLNPALPLVREEYVEWGNPKDEKTYWRLRKLSPYDNVREVAYPAVAVVVCVGDTLVNYYEALKWTLRLRQRTTGVAPIVVKVYKVGGHSGRSGWYENYRVEADLLAFACNQMGISE